MFIEADHEKLQYCGRIDWRDAKAPIFIYPCTSLGLKFTGNRLKIHVKNKNAYWDNYLGCILDGNPLTLPLPKEGEACINVPIAARQKESVPAGLPLSGEQAHEALFFKRQDACHELTVLGLEIEDGGALLPMPEKPKRKLEFYGDSVSAGEVSEAVAYAGQEDPEHNGEYSNSWHSYAWLTAQKLNAQIHDIAQGGAALMDKTGWFYEPDAVGMESIWDTLHYNPTFGETVKWDFAGYTPQAVVVAIGQNDSHPTDYMKEDEQGEKAACWRAHYGNFLRKLRKQYPSAQIICCTTLLEHDAAWNCAIGQAVQKLGDPRITQYLFKRNGTGTPGHLRIPEAEEMARELADFFETLAIEGWEE